MTDALLKDPAYRKARDDFRRVIDELSRMPPNIAAIRLFRLLDTRPDIRLLAWQSSQTVKQYLKTWRDNQSTMDDILEKPALDLAEAAAMVPPQRTVTVDLDADLVQFLEAEGMKLDDNINGLLRFYMDTSQSKEREFAPDAWEPGEMVPAP